MNRVVLKGNIGRDPTIWRTQDGREVATFFLATNTTWRDETGGLQQATEWHRITVFREATVRWVKNYRKQGDTLYLEGKLIYQPYTDKYGQPCFRTHVVITEKDGRIEYIRSSQLRSEEKKEGAEDVSFTTPTVSHVPHVQKDGEESEDGESPQIPSLDHSNNALRVIQQS